MFTENLLATVLSVLSAIAAVILVILFGKFDRVCDFELSKLFLFVVYQRSAVCKCHSAGPVHNEKENSDWFS